MINNIGIPGLLLIAVAVLVLFGRGKISSLMGEVGQGLSAFRKGLAEEESHGTPQGRAVLPDASVEDEISADLAADTPAPSAGSAR